MDVLAAEYFTAVITEVIVHYVKEPAGYNADRVMVPVEDKLIIVPYGMIYKHPKG